MTTVINGSGSADFETVLPAAEGGTGATASTGSGNVVLSASPTLTGTVGAALITSTTASGENKLTVKADAASQQASISLQVQAGTPGQTVMYMGKVGATTNGQVGYNPTTNKMSFFTNNSEKMAIAADGAVSFTTWTTASRPTSPTNGQMGYNSTLKSMEVYIGSWLSMAQQFTATGGTISTSGAYTIHTFNSSGTFTPNKVGTVEYLVIAGGGGGNGDSGGGGGAGGYRTATGFDVAATGLTVTVGAGGAYGYSGVNSVFSSITSVGGGRGSGNAVGSYVCAVGGSGGGASGGSGSTNGCAGTSGQGNSGGNSNISGPNYPAGGGGGAGGGGYSATGGSSNGGNGGVGLASSISGSSIYRGGGGGGGGGGTDSVGGNGGGGATGASGTANTGGGGGGDSSGGAGAGGSGVVIIRYLT